jgi:hypothetical protein
MSSVTPSNDFVDVRPETQNSRVLSPTQLTDFELKSMEEQQRRLKYFTDTTNEEQSQTQEREVFINLSLVELFQHLSTTIIVIINELLSMTAETTFSDLVYIFIRGDRLIYLGLLTILIAVGVYLVDVTS